MSSEGNYNLSKKGLFIRTDQFRLYDLRHTFASRMALAGIDLITLAALPGHSRVQMVVRYAPPVEERKIEAIQKLEEYNKRKQKKAA